MRVCKWYTYGDDDGRERMVRLLRELKPGDLFVFKIHNRLNDLYEPYDGPMAPDGSREMKARFLKKQYSTEYAVMKRTGKREYVWSQPDTYDLSAKPTVGTIESFYESYFFDRDKYIPGDKSIRTFDNLDDPVMKLTFATQGIDVEKLPVFSMEYDDRNMFIRKDGSVSIVIF